MKRLSDANAEYDDALRDLARTGAKELPKEPAQLLQLVALQWATVPRHERADFVNAMSRIDESCIGLSLQSGDFGGLSVALAHIFLAWHLERVGDDFLGYVEAEKNET